MSKFEEKMAQRNQRERRSALDSIAGIEEEGSEPVAPITEAQTVPIATPEDPEVKPQYAYRPKMHKRVKQSDTHTSQAYMIENELISIIDEIVGDTWGGKYRFVNEAIKLAIYQEFPEYAHRIKESE